MSNTSREIIAEDHVQIITQSHVYQGVVDFVDKERHVLGMRSGFMISPLLMPTEEPPVFQVAKKDDKPWEIAFGNIKNLMLLKTQVTEPSEKAEPVLS